MTDEQVNELLAIEVMKFLTGTVKTYTVEEWSWRDSDGVYLMRKDDWSPITNIEQAWDCLYKAQHEGLEVDFSINPIPTKEELARNICLALCEAVKK